MLQKLRAAVEESTIGAAQKYVTKPTVVDKDSQGNITHA